VPPPRLILASASPRRQELLRGAGYAFDVIAANVPEDDNPPAMPPIALAQHLASLKAHAVGRQHPDAVVLGADTVVAFGDRVIGKPRDADDARNILTLLAGTTHVVITGIAVIHHAAGLYTSSRVLSAVRMRDLTPQEIDAYVATGQWQGKAGGYGIQDDDPFVTRMSGCHTNIVGLPVLETQRMLERAGIHPAADRG
jgi:septum formation protein